jgi:hypothetical protein
MRLTALLPGLLAVFLLSFSTSDNNDSVPGAFQKWKFIGDKRVNFTVDRDVIHLGNIKDDFRKLVIRVTDGPVKMLDMKVYFDNGSVQDVQLRALIPQGGSSRVIDLEGGLRHLSKIEFWYETAGFTKGKARVAVWGRK